MLKFLYNRYKERFYDFLIEDFYGIIPEEVREPSIDFLQKARPSLERFWSIQAYNIQRRSISDPKNAQLYQGFLLNIRTLLAIVSKGNVGERENIKTEKTNKDDPFQNIKDFVKLNKTK